MRKVSKALVTIMLPGLLVAQIPRPGDDQIPRQNDELSQTFIDSIIRAFAENRLIDRDYVFCNAFQIFLERRDAWEPVYQQLGAQPEDLEFYVGNYESAMRESCARRTNGPAYENAMREIVEFRDTVDRHIASMTGVSISDARRGRIELIAEEMENLREFCFVSDELEGSLLLERLPLTPDIGQGQQVSPISRAWGACEPTADQEFLAGAQSDGRFSSRRYHECIMDVARNAQECQGPLEQGGDETPKDSEPEGGPETITASPGDMDRIPERIEDRCDELGEACHYDPTTETYVLEQPGGGRTEVDIDRNTAGKPTEIRIRRSGGKAPPINLRFVPEDTERDLEEARPEAAPDIVRAADPPDDGQTDDGQAEEGQAGGFLDAAANALWFAFQAMVYRGNMVVIDEETGMPLGWETMHPPGPDTLCATFDAATQSWLAYNSTVSEGQVVPRRLKLAHPDALRHCLCEAFSDEEDMPSELGLSCGDQDFRERMDCLRQPFDFAGVDEILRWRQKCLKYLMMDNEQVDPALICQSVLRCPDWARVQTTVSEENLHCGCNRFVGLSTSLEDRLCAHVDCPDSTLTEDPTAIDCCTQGTPVVPGGIQSVLMELKAVPIMKRKSSKEGGSAPPNPER